MAQSTSAPEEAEKASIIYNPKYRAWFFQIVAILLVVFLGYEFVQNARENIANQNISSGFGFLENTAGFGISQTLIQYSESSTYGRVFWVGLMNTLLVAAIGIVFATILGFLVGIGRLSKNWLISTLCGAYVEVIRNLPLLFQILFWYLAVLRAMPNPRDSISLLGGNVFISNRGVMIPEFILHEGWQYVFMAFIIGLVASFIIKYWSDKRQEATGQTFPVLYSALGLVIVLPIVIFFLAGSPITHKPAQLQGFNFSGGVRIIPEFVALTISLVTYTAAFIAEVVRAGILAVPHGQTEAAYSLGMRSGPTLRLVVIPQAMRVIIPPLTSQYLNLTKNSTLAVGIGYPDLFAVFAGTTLNQTGQAVEIILITMATYLVISLLTSMFMNWYNKRVSLVER